MKVRAAARAVFGNHETFCRYSILIQNCVNKHFVGPTLRMGSEPCRCELADFHYIEATAKPIGFAKYPYSALYKQAIEKRAFN